MSRWQASHWSGYTKDCHVHAFLDVNHFHAMFGGEVTSFVGCIRGVPRSGIDWVGLGLPQQVHRSSVRVGLRGSDGRGGG